VKEWGGAIMPLVGCSGCGMLRGEKYRIVSLAMEKAPDMALSYVTKSHINKKENYAILFLLMARKRTKKRAFLAVFRAFMLALVFLAY
jgi:hypothetical protein